MYECIYIIYVDRIVTTFLCFNLSVIMGIPIIHSLMTPVGYFERVSMAIRIKTAWVRVS